MQSKNILLILEYMEQLHDNFDTLVIVGSWNKYIFSEEWIVSNILGEGVKYSIQYPLNALGSLRFSLENFTFCIFGERLVFQLNNNSETSYKEVIKTARKIFQKLIHTPVTAMGVNFLFRSNKSFNIVEYMPQNSELVQHIGYDIVSSEITRTFKISENEVLNFKIELKDEVNIFNFNFNYNIKSLDNILDIIEDNDELILCKSDIAKKIIEKICEDEGK